MSLRLQLVLVATLVLLVSLVIGGALAYSSARGKVRTEMHAAMAVGERVARNAIDNAGASIDPRRALPQIVHEFDGDRHLRASWVDESGRVLASSRVAPATDAAPEWLYRLLAGRPDGASLALPATLQDRSRLELETDPHNEIAEAWDDIKLTLSIMSIFCGLVLLLTLLALGYALRPLSRLSAAFTRVGGGNYREPVAERGPLELARLCHGFNRMVDRLSKIEAENSRLQEQLAAVQEEERADFARDLHDEVGPFLFAVSVDATMIKQFLESGTHGEIAARSDAIREATEHMQKHIRTMLGRLRPGILLDVGLTQALHNLITFWRTRQPGIAFDMSLPNEGIERPLDEVVYRIIQESLSNAVRHGLPRRIEISVTRDTNDVLVSVADDGRGFQPLGHKPGYGLAGMEERVRALAGTFAVRRRTTGGVIVSARLPESRAAPEFKSSAIAMSA